MVKKLFALLLPLCLAASLLAGCGSGPTPAEVEPPAKDGDPDVLQIKTGLGPMATYLDLDGLSQETLDSCYEALDLTQENPESGSALHLTETMGDSTLLYVAFTLTCPPAEGGLPDLLASLLLGDGSSSSNAPAFATELRIEETGDGSFNCLAAFDYIAAETLSAGEPLALMVEGRGVDASNPAFPLAISWTPQRLAPVQSVELKNEAGEAVGTALLSPLSLKLLLTDSGGQSGEALSNAIALLDGKGNALEVNAAFTFHDSLAPEISGVFFAPVEPAAVHTIQVGPFTGELSH